MRSIPYLYGGNKLGQRAFGIATPEYFQEHNDQGELTLSCYAFKL